MISDLNKTVDYWLETAAYDLETGKTLLRSKRYPYALFFGHLALEKILKALVVKKTNQHAPFTHSLIMLAGRTGAELSGRDSRSLGGIHGISYGSTLSGCEARLLSEMHQGVCQGKVYRD